MPTDLGMYGGDTYAYGSVVIPTFQTSAATTIAYPLQVSQFVQQPMQMQVGEMPDDWDFARNRKMTPLEYLDKRVDEVCRLAFAA